MDAHAVNALRFVMIVLSVAFTTAQRAMQGGLCF
jgi:hypothetical protein